MMSPRQNHALVIRILENGVVMHWSSKVETTQSSQLKLLFVTGFADLFFA